ncbi:MAG: AAA family ATPase [Spirochaetaceae bacterium]
MPRNPKQYRHPPLRKRRQATSLEAVDTQWKAYHRYVFRVGVDHFSPSEDLVQFALSIAEPGELNGLVGYILERRESLDLRPDAISDLASVAGQSEPTPSHHRLKQLCFRVARHNEVLHPTVVDYMVDSLDTADASFGTGAPPPFPEIVAQIAALFGLRDEQTRILIALYALEDIDPIGEMMREATHRSQIRILADVAGVDLTIFVRETAPGAALERLGLVTFRGGRDEIADVSVSRALLFALRSNTLDDLRAGLFDDTPDPRFCLEEFSVPEDEIRTCTAAIRGGYALLIAGEPGIGKTEFARTLITALHRRPHTLATTNRHSDTARGPRGFDTEGGRLNAVRMAVNLLSRESDVLIIDEADALLQSAAGFFALFGAIPGGGSYDKAILNDLLDLLPVATIWITNDHRMIPPSALRRFGHVYAFPHPSIETRVRMLSDRLASLVGADTNTANLGASWTRDLAARYDITPAAIDRTARIIAAELDADEITPAELRDRVTGYIEQISTGALARDVRRLPTVASSFDPRFCSPSESLDRVERQALHRAQTGRGLRLLFAGPPGGGKTQYALWLARRLGRDVVLKRPSDLLSKYVGESEQQIAAAFRAAAQSGSVLVLDEADALLYDRSIAQRSWEHSQIAEFLQQIQEFTGILVACTNRVDAVDPALRRRFHKHVTFGPISEELLRPALAHIFPEVTFAAGDIAALLQGPPLMMSDLATAAEMLELEASENSAGAAASTVVEEILANARSRDRVREIGF